MVLVTNINQNIANTFWHAVVKLFCLSLHATFYKTHPTDEGLPISFIFNCIIDLEIKWNTVIAVSRILNNACWCHSPLFSVEGLLSSNKRLCIKIGKNKIHSGKASNIISKKYSKNHLGYMCHPRLVSQEMHKTCFEVELWELVGSAPQWCSGAVGAP